MRLNYIEMGYILSRKVVMILDQSQYQMVLVAKC